jgi:outer membrane protein assembly factor BamB
MALSNGGIYMGWGSFCDGKPWHGWFMRYDETTLNQTAVYNASPNGYGAGIWMSGAAPAVDSSGAIYLTTGNGTFDDASSTLPPVAPNSDLGMSVLKFDPVSLAVQDFFTPQQVALWNSEDQDVSATGVVVLPDGVGPSGHSQLLLSGDKEGHLYLLDRNGMGEFSSVANNSLQFLAIPNIMTGCVAHNDSACIYSTPSYYNGTVYIGASEGPLTALPLTSGELPEDGNGNVAPASQTNDSFNFPGPFSTVSASPAGGGVVWVLDNSDCGNDCHPLGAAILRAYDAGNLSTTLYSSTTVLSDQAGTAIKYAQPVIANGRVYIGGGGTVTVYGLAP